MHIYQGQNAPLNLYLGQPRQAWIETDECRCTCQESLELHWSWVEGGAWNTWMDKWISEIGQEMWMTIECEQFSTECRGYPGLHCFCFTSLCDWPRELAPLSDPIRFKTKTNCDLVAFFPRFWQFVCFSWEFSLALVKIWLAVVIALV